MIFPKGLVHDFGQKFETFLLPPFGQNKPWKKMFADVLDRKEAFPVYKNIYFTWSPNWIFRKGLDNAFG